MSVLGRDHGRMRAAGFRHGTEAADPSETMRAVGSRCAFAIDSISAPS